MDGTKSLNQLPHGHRLKVFDFDKIELLKNSYAGPRWQANLKNLRKYPNLRFLDALVQKLLKCSLKSYQVPVVQFFGSFIKNTEKSSIIGHQSWFVRTSSSAYRKRKQCFKILTETRLISWTRALKKYSSEASLIKNRQKNLPSSCYSFHLLKDSSLTEILDSNK